MPEDKSTKKPVAADKRKAANDALEARIAARKNKSLAEVDTATTAKSAKLTGADTALPVETPVAHTPEKPKVVKTPKAVKVESELPWEEEVVTAGIEAPKARKPRVAIRKPKAEVAPVEGVSDLVAKIEAKVTSRLQKEHAKELSSLVKKHKDDTKQMMSKVKEEAKEAATLCAAMLKSKVGEAEKAAYEAGLKAGEKTAHKAIAAALKGR